VRAKKNDDGSWTNCSVFRKLGTISSGGRVRAEVEFIAASGAYGQLLLGSPGDDHFNEDTKIGAGVWRKIEVTVEYECDALCVIHLYGNRAAPPAEREGTFVLYRNLRIFIQEPGL